MSSSAQPTASQKQTNLALLSDGVKEATWELSRQIPGLDWCPLDETLAREASAWPPHPSGAGMEWERILKEDKQCSRAGTFGLLIQGELHAAFSIRVSRDYRIVSLRYLERRSDRQELKGGAAQIAVESCVKVAYTLRQLLPGLPAIQIRGIHPLPALRDYYIKLGQKYQGLSSTPTALPRILKVPHRETIIIFHEV